MIFGRGASSFAACGLSLLEANGDYSEVTVHGFSLWRLLKFIRTESRMMVPKAEGRGESGVIV